MPAERRSGKTGAAGAADAPQAVPKTPAQPGVAGYDVRVRIRDGDAPVFGPGRLTLLRAIDETGSISAAARGMGMSSGGGWLRVEAMNHESREPRVPRHIGGVSGGGAQLTPFAQNLTAHYDTLVREIRSLLDAHVPTFDAYLKGRPVQDPDDA